MHLTMGDVDLSGAVLTVRNTKFYKNRLVPVGPQLLNALKAYAVRRAERPTLEGSDSSFLANRDGHPWQKGPSRARLQICFPPLESTVLMANDNLRAFIRYVTASPYTG